MVTYILLMLSGLLCKLYCLLYLKVEVIGRENVPKRTKGVLFASNHQTLIDSWFIGTLLKPFSYLIFSPGILPWNAPEATNFFKTPVMRFIFSHLKCLPVTRGSVGKAFFQQISKILKNANLLIFFEGTRTRNGLINNAKPGIGRIIYENKPIVIPIRIKGFQEVMPVGSKWHFFLKPFYGRKKVAVIYGSPIDFTDLLQQNRRADLFQDIADRVKITVEQL